MWALSVAYTMNIPLKLFTTEPNGTSDQQSFEQKRPYLPRKIYCPDLSNIGAVGRCVIIDDVLSGGGTVSQKKDIIEQNGGTVIGFVCVIDKMGVGPELSKKWGAQAPVISLKCPIES